MAEKGARHPSGMDDDTKRPTDPHYGPDPLGHLRAPPPGRGQSEEWKARESARRAGRGRKDWWKKYLPPEKGDA